MLRWEREGTRSADCCCVECRFTKVSQCLFGLFQLEMCSRVEGEPRASYSLEKQHCLMPPEQGQVAAVST